MSFNNIPKEPENPIHALVDTDPMAFEKFLLRAVDGSKVVYERVRDTLCKTDLGGDIDDFGVPAHNEIYRAMAQYYFIRHDIPAANMPAQVARSMLTNAATSGAMNISLDDIEPSVAYLDELRELALADAVAITIGGFEYWLKKRRLKRLFNSVTAQENWKPDLLIEAAQAQRAAIDKAGGQTQTKFSFGAGIKAGVPVSVRYSTGIAKLDSVMGGGVGRKEHVMWIAGTGAGKTVMACQQAVTLCNQDQIGILITTEQPHDELEPRIVSAWCNIPFNRIKDGIDPSKLTHDELVRMNTLMDFLGPRLYIEDWMNDRSKTVDSDLDSLVAEYKREHGRCDFVILDWIGGALGEADSSNPAGLRLVYLKTADKLSDLARQHNMITMSFAQGHPIQAKNRKRVDYTHLAECKSLGRNATVILGISAMENDMEANDAAPTYKDEQYIHCSKGRKSQPAPVRVRREFEYQRFRDWWT